MHILKFDRALSDYYNAIRMNIAIDVSQLPTDCDVYFAFLDSMYLVMILSFNGIISTFVPSRDMPTTGNLLRGSYGHLA